ncbi:unnamed protein product [Gongylonema pulchrum]|uniref:WW domain-containing protein n=1 Tax=Gongylonema pulchrum TaxID=637853 RepID=A0A183EHN3_9BILA|nr:unnamed protein product [Gongylonema pulchrum]
MQFYFAALQQSDLQATLSMMEAAACKSAMIGPSPKSKTYMDPRAHSASVAAMAHQMALRRKQKMEQRKTEPSAEETKSETDSETVWVEAKTETGVPYYFHMYSGTTVWDRPENYYTAEQYAMKLAVLGTTTDALTQSNITVPIKTEAGTLELKYASFLLKAKFIVQKSETVLWACRRQTHRKRRQR